MPTVETTHRQLLSPSQAAQLFGYSCTQSFLRAARRARIPRIRVNARVIRFDPIELEAWKTRRAA